MTLGGRHPPSPFMRTDAQDRAPLWAVTPYAAGT